VGDCPGFLREAFLHWALDGQPDAAIVDGPFALAEWPWKELCSRLRQCSDPMPDDLCEWLGVTLGTTYAATARRLLREAGASGSTALRGVDADGLMRRWTGSEWVRLDSPNDERETAE
jgi:hypothetical protein